MIERGGNFYFEKHTVIRGLIQVLIYAWILIFIFWGVCVVNATFYVSNCVPMGGPCRGDMVVSDIGKSVGWIAFCMSGFHLLFFFGIYLLIAAGRARGCVNLGLGIAVACWMVQIMALVAFLSDRVNCNVPNDPQNICTSYEACLVPDFFNYATNRCPNSPFGARSYTLTLANLYPRTDFVWTLTLHGILVFLDFAILVVFSTLWCGLFNILK